MTINCNGNLVDISSPKVMGILNITPDSFYEGSRFNDESEVLKKVEAMLTDGATFIDVGAYSSRPGADDIAVEEELKRITPIVEAIVQTFPEVLLSVDTFRSKVATYCIEAGAAIINDISAGHLDEHMIESVGKLGVPYIMMHMKGTPQTMKDLCQYDDLLFEMNYYFSKQIAKCHKYQVTDIIIDPGFGFAKTTEQNFELLNKLEILKICDKPILVGLSRKSMIYKTLNTDSKNALNGTTSLNTIALLKGASILRVHDVKEAVECISLVNQLH